MQHLARDALPQEAPTPSAGTTPSDDQGSRRRSIPARSRTMIQMKSVPIANGSVGPH